MDLWDLIKHLQQYQVMANGLETVSTAPPANTRYEEIDTRKIYRRAIPSSPEATKTFTFGTSQVPAGNNVSCVVADSGTKMYLASNNAGDNQAGYQYTLSTAYDVSTASYASKSFSSWGSSDIRGMKVKNNGQYFYRMSDQTNNKKDNNIKSNHSTRYGKNFKRQRCKTSKK